MTKIDDVATDRRRALGRWAGWSGVAIFVLPLVTSIVSLSNRGPVAVTSAIAGPALAGLAIVLTCSFAAAAASPPAKSAWTIIARLLIVLICIPLPISLFVFVRLSIKVCSIIDVLGLPWPAGLAETVHFACGASLLAALAGLVLGLLRAGLRGTSFVMLVYAGTSVLVALVLLFFSTYGDPAAGCVPF